MTAVEWTVQAGPVLLDVRLLPWFLVRAPGHPIELVDALSSARLLDMADELIVMERALNTHEREFLDEHWPALRRVAKSDPERAPAPFRELLRAYRRIESGDPLDDRANRALTAAGVTRWAEEWNLLLGRRDTARTKAAQELAAASSDAYRQVARAFDEPSLRHAVFLSNPGFYRNALASGPLTDRLGNGAGPPRAARRRLATAHRYLRRFTTRCETVAFSGPTLFGRFSPDQAEPLHVGRPGPPRVSVEASVWAVDLLERHLTSITPLAGRRAWRDPTFRRLPGKDILERTVDGRRLKVPADLLQLWEGADGRPLGEIARDAGIGEEALLDALRRLSRLLTVSGHRSAATELHALDALAAADRPDGPATALRSVRNVYAAEPWPARADRHTAAEEVIAGLGERPDLEGRHYADREVFHEDWSSPYSERVTIGGPALDGLRRALDAVLPMTYLAALLAREDAREVVRYALRGEGAPLARLAAAALEPQWPRVERMRAALAGLVRDGHAAGGVAALTSQDVADAVADLWELVPEADRADPCLPSPDLMAVGEDLATATWVLAELHDDCSSVFGGLERTVHSRPDLLWREFEDAVRDLVPAETMATIVSRRRSAHVTPELPGASIELSGLSARPRAETVPIGEVTVPPDATTAIVRGAPRRLYPGDLSSPLHRALALPALTPLTVEIGAHTPRITIDGVVVQRARWRVRHPGTPAAEAVERWAAMHRLRVEHGLPRRVFVRHPAEPKPLYIDFADPLGVDDLARMREGELVITEMLPGPEELWWRVDGRAQCAELRLGCLISARTKGPHDDSRA
ncbi:lantibiotic dehydratase [Actinomadura craniellae]|uniref:Lantibiotic dehydratase n=1 Tax=Actinomadura craniellae TaxID=2231787 RepID=A0A365HAN2_9ACTN|nr:lantibiotic dehydratase [Actinomadura craniellae]RAY16141.1 lantibiotic dehydratase [Actinomadura craniellae]